MPCKGDKKKIPLPFGKSASCLWRAGKEKFSQISVNFALRGVVGIKGRNVSPALAKSPLAALKILREAHTEEAATF